VPLPAGFGIDLDADSRMPGPGVLLGGSPARLLRLSPAGQRAFAELLGGPVRSSAAGRLARCLTDAGLAHPRPPATAPRPAVTVVIPVRDRPAELERCLSSLGPGYPVIVVDDGSEDPAATARACQRHNVLLLRRPVPGGPGPARNDGLALVRTPLVAFLDSDCVTGPEWIDELAGHFADPMVAAVAPRVRPLAGHGAVGRYLDARAPVDMGPRPARVAPLTRQSYVPTAALLARTEAVTGAGGFDPTLRFGEDVDLIWRLSSAGWRIRYDPAVEVRHAEPGTWRKALARRYRYGNSAAPLAVRHPGEVPPLVLRPWPAAVVAATLAARPLLALAAYSAGAGQMRRLVREWDLPRGTLRPMAGIVGQTWLGVGRWAAQFALPAAAAGLARPGRHDRLIRRLAIAGLLAAPPAVTWLRCRPRLDLFRFTLAYLADEAAYGAGVCRGAWRERTAAPLLPLLATGGGPGRASGPRPSLRATLRSRAPS
jgi:mycofactocin system glycosyltransferase